ncbi:MAG: hypothetical protein HOP27_10655 [Anaerolineales bacterium]|nr:hypothetical protein [Anaerolineales bacterium]
MPKVDPKSQKIGLMSEYEKMEVREIFERTRTIDNLRIQIYSFFGTVNITFLGLGVSAQHAGVFLIAASTIGLLALIERRMRDHQFQFYARGLELEEKFSPDRKSALLYSYLEKRNYVSQSRLRRYWLPLSVFTFEILMAVLSWYFLGWNWF